MTLPTSVDAPLLHLGDCVAWLRSLPEGSVDAIVTDGPYGLSPDGRARTWDDLAQIRQGAPRGFMGKAWDAACPGRTWAEACLRVLKPGGHLVGFGATRTIHRLTCAVEDAGFEVRDQIGWVYFNGFAKNKDISKAIDDAAGAERTEVIGRGWHHGVSAGRRMALNEGWGKPYQLGDAAVGEPILAPATSAAQQWSGYGTALKPAVEPAVLARRPLDGTVAANVLRHGTGGLNIDACRFADGDPAWVGPQDNPDTKRPGNMFRGHIYGDGEEGTAGGHPLGRWPANLYHTPKAPRKERERGLGPHNMLCQCSTPAWTPSRVVDGLQVCTTCHRWDRQPTGTAAVDREEGSAGLRNPRAGAGRTAGALWGIHPTVKPVALMRWLCRLVTPPGGLVVDPFLGSGSTGVAAVLEGFRFAGAEMEPDYHAIASARIAHALAHPEQWDAKRKPRRPRAAKPEPAPEATQIALFAGARR